MDTPEHTKKEIEHTLVIKEADDSAKGKTKGTGSSRIFGDAPQSIDPVDLEADSSLDFRKDLEISGKRYKILRMIGEGGFGRIFLAKDLVLGREVVIKSLKENHLVRDESVRKFISEAKLNAQLDHPSIVPIYSLDTDTQDGLHLAMRLVHGVTMKEYLQRCREKEAKETIDDRRHEHSLQTRLEYFLKACDAIEYCHARGIVHCDLKPENIMLGRNGEIYVMDWGIACAAGTNRKGHLDGTPAYMAPEALRDGATTPMTDVFALGMILNELVSLRGPIVGADSKEVIARICSGDYEPSTSKNPRIRISPALRAIVEKAREPELEYRYQSVRELADDIRHWLFREEVAAYPDSLFQKTMRFLFRHRYATAIILVSVLFLSAVLALYGARRQQCVAAKVTQEMMRRLKVQFVTEDLANEIDNRLLRLAEQLKGLATAQLIEQNAPDRGKDTGRFYLAEEFAESSPVKPPNLLETPFYRHRFSLDDAAYFKPAKMSRETLWATVSQLRTSRRQGLTLICDGMEDGEEITDFTSEAVFSRFRQNGSLLRSITYLMDNGVTLRYPGTYEAADFPEKLRAQWSGGQSDGGIKTARWISPYLDSSDHAVVACWMPLVTVHGQRSGRVGFELCIHKLFAPLLRQSVAESHLATYYLLDAESKQIFSSDDQEARRDCEQDCERQLDLNGTFPYPEWLNHYRRGSIQQFIARLADGRLVRVSIARIPQAGWTLIRVVPPGILDRIDQDLDQRNRQDIEQEIFMERELFAW
ncbi:MAG: serine/threonine protein kinase [Victivallales bacterium]|nr:serine/threonine protein kinase [Victivallales bacterium]